MHTKPEASSELVKKFVVEGLQEIKGENITVLDLREIENAVTDFFIIAEGNSNTQVNSLADSVHKVVKRRWWFVLIVPAIPCAAGIKSRLAETKRTSRCVDYILRRAWNRRRLSL